MNVLVVWQRISLVILVFFIYDCFKALTAWFYYCLIENQVKHIIHIMLHLN